MTSPSRKLRGLYILQTSMNDLVYSVEERRDIAALIDIPWPPVTPQMVRENPALLDGVNVVFSTWGCPQFDDTLLAHAGSLELLLYGAGSISQIPAGRFWETDIQICSAWAANAVPVSEFTLAQIILSLKRFWLYADTYKQEKRYCNAEFPIAGGYRSTVGLVSLGMIGSRVATLLKNFDIRVLAWSPYTKPHEAQALGVTLVPTLEDLFAQSDVVSLHTAWKKETENLITGRHLALMKPNSTFINTSRGAIVTEPEMIQVLQKRPDLWAVLDVTYPEPPAKDSPLFTLPNVVLTPHISGAMHAECRRMGRYMIDELQRHLKGEPLKWNVSRESFALMA